MARLFDSHAHYIDDRFAELDGGVDGLLTSLFSGEVGNIINVATNIADAAPTLAMAARYEQMYAAVGIHPEDAQKSPDLDADLAALEQLISQRQEHKIVALGEIGFDYYWQPVDKAVQAYAFEEQMKMALRHDVPVVIHDREAHGDCFDML